LNFAHELCSELRDKWNVLQRYIPSQLPPKAKKE
jgi:hypothetical protein